LDGIEIENSSGSILIADAGGKPPETAMFTDGFPNSW